jgi:hypothetical protein
LDKFYCGNFEYSTYTPVLALSDFHPFPEMKTLERQTDDDRGRIERNGYELVKWIGSRIIR